MAKINKRIEIVRSEAKAFSSMSEESSNAVSTVLSKYYSSVRISNINRPSDLFALAKRRPDLVFLGMEYIPSNILHGMDDPEKIWLSDFLEAHDILYTGSRQPAHEAVRNKASAKQRIINAGLKTPKYLLVEDNEQLINKSTGLRYPLFVKPSNRGGGLGIDADSVVHNMSQLLRKTEKIHKSYQTAAIVEEFMPGREFSVAILRDVDTGLIEVMPIELIAPADSNGAQYLSAQIKSSNSEQAVPVNDLSVKLRISELALNAFYALGARDFGRIDIRLDAAGEPHFLEANLIPSLISGYGSFPKSCHINLGLDYEPMILAITKLGFSRAGDKEKDIEPAFIRVPVLPLPSATN